MFSAHEDQAQGGRIEEEIITDETYAIQDSTIVTELPDDGQYIHSTKSAVYEMCSSPPSCATTTSHSIQFHPSTTMVYGMNEHLHHQEPQEAPLELTTNHRMERMPCSKSPPVHSSSYSPAFIQAGRPGVIVVKQS